MSRRPMTIVVPTKDRPQLLHGCLATITEALRPEDELIVVDSASRSQSTRDVARSHNATYIRSEIAGASIARNLGWRAAKHEIIAFVDDDVEVDPGWAQGVAGCFAEFPDASFISGRVGRKPGDELTPPIPYLVHPDGYWIDDAFEGDVGHSANIAVRRSALETIGGFDEKLGGGTKFRAAEDKDLIDRLLGAGFRGRFEPQASVVHLVLRRMRDLLKLEWSYGFGTGARAAKLLKTDRSRARKIMRQTYWTWGIADIGRAIRRRQAYQVLFTSVRVFGMLVGLLRAAPHRVTDGHFGTPTHANHSPRASPRA